MAEKQMTEDRGQMAEIRGQKSAAFAIKASARQGGTWLNRLRPNEIDFVFHTASV